MKLVHGVTILAQNTGSSLGSSVLFFFSFCALALHNIQQNVQAACTCSMPTGSALGLMVRDKIACSNNLYSISNAPPTIIRPWHSYLVIMVIVSNWDYNE